MLYELICFFLAFAFFLAFVRLFVLFCASFTAHLFTRSPFGAYAKELMDLRLKWSSLFCGALPAAVLFSFGKEAFVLYVTRIGIGSAYGALSSIMIFLIWMYLSIQVILLGAAFAYACECRKDGS